MKSSEPTASTSTIAPSNSFDGSTTKHSSHQEQNNYVEEKDSQDALPPVDHGHKAWLCLFGCFVSNALIWGFVRSFGVLQEFYSAHEPFASQPGIPAIGTTATGLMYLPMPLYLIVYQKHPRCRAYSIWASIPIMVIALIAASFSNTVPVLITCQSVLFAIGGNCLSSPAFTYLDEWFVARRGLALGIMLAGDGCGGAIMPFVLQALLDKVGFRWTLRVVAMIVLVVITPLILVLKPRVSTSTSVVSPTNPSVPLDFGFMKTPAFWIWEIFNVVQALGYFLPDNYLPTITEKMGFSHAIGSLTLTLINVTSIIGSIAIGALVDHFDTSNIVMLVSIGASTATFTPWGLSTCPAGILIFCTLYGLTAGGYSSTWGSMAKSVQRQHPAADVNLLYGLLAAGRGLGSIVSGPVSDALLAHGPIPHAEVNASSLMSKYGLIVVFSGCALMLGGCSWLFKRFGLIK